MNLAELFLGQIPEAVYFGLFLVLAKDIREKRILFIALMILEYLLLKRNLVFNTWFQVSYTVMTFLTLKVLYKDKANITDIFTFGIASIILIATCAISFMIFGPNMKLVALVSRLLPMIFLIVTNKRLHNIQKLYSKLWNRSNTPKKIKSTTFRSLNIVIFNIMFYIINLGMMYALLVK